LERFVGVKTVPYMEFRLQPTEINEIDIELPSEEQGKQLGKLDDDDLFGNPGPSPPAAQDTGARR
jgi:hypothetical protein